MSNYVITVCDNANESYPIFPTTRSEYIGAFLNWQRLKAMRRNVWRPFEGFAML